jgi:hypothetical protein
MYLQKKYGIIIKKGKKLIKEEVFKLNFLLYLYTQYIKIAVAKIIQIPNKYIGCQNNVKYGNIYFLLLFKLVFVLHFLFTNSFKEYKYKLY